MYHASRLVLLFFKRDYKYVCKQSRIFVNVCVIKLTLLRDVTHFPLQSFLSAIFKICEYYFKRNNNSYILFRYESEVTIDK